MQISISNSGCFIYRAYCSGTLCHAVSTHLGLCASFECLHRIRDRPLHPSNLVLKPQRLPVSYLQGHCGCFVFSYFTLLQFSRSMMSHFRFTCVMYGVNAVRCVFRHTPWCRHQPQDSSDSPFWKASDISFLPHLIQASHIHGHRIAHVFNRSCSDMCFYQSYRATSSRSDLS